MSTTEQPGQVSPGKPLLEARDVVVEYGSGHHRTKAVAGVSLDVCAGEVVGLIGESGSGKSTLCRTLLGLIEPTAGGVFFRGEDIYAIRSRVRYRRLGREISMVFQDPRSSLNPRLSVGAVLNDPLHVHDFVARGDRHSAISMLLKQVGLDPKLANRPVRSLSGGQLQRVALARALAVEPTLIAADEPTSALDVSVQAQILNLLHEIREQRGLALLVVSHDIRVIRFLATRTAVMYRGEIVEAGPTDAVFEDAQHDYTKKLLSAAPKLSLGDRLTPSEATSPLAQFAAKV